MPKKTIPPRLDLAGEPQKNRFPDFNSRSVLAQPATLLKADLRPGAYSAIAHCNASLAQRLAEYQEKLTQDYRKAVEAIATGEARLCYLNDWLSDLEHFETDGGSYALDG